MTEHLHITAADRVLVLAPHPDDESIACGGLLLAARDAGAPRRVVVVTDGDNNPWPQRWIEKRWRIDAAARARWGARRRAEAQAALGLLGVDASERFFLGMPDLGLTGSLMRDPSRLPDCLLEHIAQFKPTHLALPTLDDRHPDHSAVHIAAQLALLHTPQITPKLLIYAVHGEASMSDTQLELSAAQRGAKQNAILQHETQMRLSRKRFLGFAGDLERFRAATKSTLARDDHPLLLTVSANGDLEVRLSSERQSGNLPDAHVLILIDFADGSRLRWRLPVAAAQQQVEISDSRDDRTVSSVRWKDAAGSLRATFALCSGSSPLLGYAKLVGARSGLIVFDRYGWQKIEVLPAN